MSEELIESHKSSKKAVLLILVLALAVSLGYSFYHRIEPVVDARAYDRIAANILAGEGFRENVSVPFAYDPAIVRAGPVYEYFLAGVYFIFGRHLEAAWIIQALFHILTAFLIYVICKKIFGPSGETAGLWAMVLFAFHPDLIEIQSMLMTETLYLFLAVLVLWIFVLVFERPEKLFFASSLGFLTGLAVLSRPPISLFIPVILFFYLSGKHVRQAVIFTAVFIAVLTPWTARNYQAYRQFIPTTLISEYNIWVGNTLLAEGGQIAGGSNPALEYAEQNSYLGFKDKARSQFKDFVIQHPLVFIKLTFLRLIRYASLIRPMGFWFYQSGIGQFVFVGASLVSIVVLFIFGFSGLRQALKKKSRLFHYLAVFALLAPLPLLAATVESRYRFQIYPLLAIFAGYFLAGFWAEKKERAVVFFQTCAVFGILSILDLYFFWSTVASRLNFLFS